jgi:putative FmdB family regulatory protein
MRALRARGAVLSGEWTMPTYEYACKTCGNEWEEIQKISDPKLDTCPKCNAGTAQRLVSQGNFILKGSGWYTTGGYGTTGTKSESSSTSSSASGDAASKGSSSTSTTAPASTTPAAAPAAAAPSTSSSGESKSST